MSPRWPPGLTWNVCCCCSLCGYVAREKVPSLVCCTQQLFLAASWMSNLLSRMISQNKCFPLHLNLRRAFLWEPARGRCSSAQARLLLLLWPPASCLSTRTLLSAQLLPPFRARSSLSRGASAVWAVTLWLPCHRPAAFSRSAAWNRLPSHVCCQPHARLHNFPLHFAGLLPPRGAPERLERGPSAHGRTPPGVSAARLLGLCPLSSPRTSTLLCRSRNEVQRASPTYRWKCPTKLQINLNFAKLSIKNMPTSLLSQRQRLSRSRLSGETNKREQHNCSRKTHCNRDCNVWGSLIPPQL